jgi:hypothetical protein
MHQPARHNVPMSRVPLVVALVALVALVGSLASPAVAAAPTAPEEFGFSMMPQARKIGPHRYQSDRGYDATVKFFREKFRSFKAVRWMREVSVPGVKYVHVANDNPEAGWDGINISQLADGSVHVLVLPRRKDGQPATMPGAAPAARTAPVRSGPTGSAPAGASPTVPSTIAAPSGR